MRHLEDNGTTLSDKLLGSVKLPAEPAPIEVDEVG